MTTVETALGAVATVELGPTLMHEHIVTRSHYTHVSDDILPALRAAGVKEDQIEQMLVRNPQAIFAARSGAR